METKKKNVRGGVRDKNKTWTCGVGKRPPHPPPTQKKLGGETSGKIVDRGVGKTFHSLTQDHKIINGIAIIVNELF